MRCGPLSVSIPQQEFQVKCYQYKAHSDSNAVPLMTCYVPCYDSGTPFKISVQVLPETSPNPKPPFLYEFPRQNRHNQVWQIRVTIDGVDKYTGEFTAETPWPITIPGNTHPTSDGQQGGFRFPQYREDLETSRPDENRGRIKVEILEGHLVKKAGMGTKFKLLARHMIFSFQYAPLAILQKNGIAYPSPYDEVLLAMNKSNPLPVGVRALDYSRPLSLDVAPQYQATGHQSGAPSPPVRRHRRSDATSDMDEFLASSPMTRPMFEGVPVGTRVREGYFSQLSAARATSRHGTAGYEFRRNHDDNAAASSRLPSFASSAAPSRVPSLASPFNYQPQAGYNGNSSRSTSAYSIMSMSAMPLQTSINYQDPFVSPSLPAAPQMLTPGTILPVPQPSAILSRDLGSSMPVNYGALPSGPAEAPSAPRAQPKTLSEMLEIVGAPTHAQKMQDTLEMLKDPKIIDRIMALPRPEQRNDDANARREAARSNQTDISMHPSCTHFPHCIHDCADGQVTHRPGPAIVRSRKEGRTNSPSPLDDQANQKRTHSETDVGNDSEMVDVEEPRKRQNVATTPIDL